MRTICLYFQVHQPFRLRRYRFFDIGNDHYYYDDYTNESVLRRYADKSYLPANKILLEAIKESKGKFKIAFSISGTALDQFELYAPDVLESFKQLAQTGQVEFICETDAHSLASLSDRTEFELQVRAHKEKIKKFFGQDPVIFRNTELIYSDQMGADIAEMGFEGMITEGAKQILGWKSPNYLYCNAINPRLKVLLRNFRLSDDISFRFGVHNWSEYPLTTEKFAHWLSIMDGKEENVNIFLDYHALGILQKKETGIFEFFKHLPKRILKTTDFTFSLPSEVVRNQQPVAPVSVPTPISWVDEERDITAWLGNDLQTEACNKLYSLTELIRYCKDPKILIDWKYLQASDHFNYMSTKFFSGRPLHLGDNPFGSPYDAFINYMNILSDFSLRVRKSIKEEGDKLEINDLLRLIEEKDTLLAQYQEQLSKLIGKSPKPKKSDEDDDPKSSKKKVVSTHT